MYLIWWESRQELEGTKKMRVQNLLDCVLIGLEITQDSSSLLKCVSNKHLSQKMRCSLLQFGCYYLLQIQKFSSIPPVRHTNHKK